jgi:phosphomevalonate kinase
MSTWSAPGKVLWAGEYAVLDGGPAVVCAVARRAVARVRGHGEPAPLLSPFLAAARDEVVAAFGPGSREAARAVRVDVDSAALAEAGTKLGLGSSAAATVAAVAAALDRDDPERIHLMAHRAHALAQAPRGARGSGADIAASVHGGLLAVQRPPGADDLTPLGVRRLSLPPGLSPVLVWTGQAAHTPTLVAKVRTWAKADPSEHASVRAGLSTAARALIFALDRADVAGAVAAIVEGAEALAALGAGAGAALVPPSFAAIAELARAHGGAAKPTGAGGGDQLLALLPSAEAAAAFGAAARAAGHTLVEAPVDPRGVAAHAARE